MKSMSETMQENEKKKRSLEEQMDSLTEEINNLRANEQMNRVASEDKWLMTENNPKL